MGKTISRLCKNIKPVFIVGMNGSGTNMLADCLNNHHLIYIHKREIRTIPFYCLNIAKFGDLKNENNFKKLLKEFSNNPGFYYSNNNLPVEIPFDFDDLSEKNLSKVIDLTFSCFASKEKKSIWGEHSPKYAVSIPQLINLFPKAKIIHIIRDGRDCASSFYRRFGKNIYRTVFQWKTLVKKAMEDGSDAGKERYYEIKYEDLTDAPEYHMRSICSFLEVPFDSRVLNSNMPTYAGGKTEEHCQQIGTIVRNSGKWHTSFTKAQIKKLEAIAGSTIADLGYKIMFTPRDKDLNGVILFLLKSVDRIRMSVFKFRKYQEADKVGNIIRVIKRSLKQDKYFVN